MPFWANIFWIPWSSPGTTDTEFKIITYWIPWSSRGMTKADYEMMGTKIEKACFFWIPWSSRGTTGTEFKIITYWIPWSSHGTTDAGFKIITYWIPWSSHGTTGTKFKTLCAYHSREVTNKNAAALTCLATPKSKSIIIELTCETPAQSHRYYPNRHLHCQMH